jgi:hypothetical protein
MLLLLFEYLLLIKRCLAVFKPVGFDVQDVPLYSSVAPVVGSPPKANAAVCIPAPAN